MCECIGSTLTVFLVTRGDGRRHPCRWKGCHSHLTCCFPGSENSDAQQKITRDYTLIVLLQQKHTLNSFQEQSVCAKQAPRSESAPAEKPGEGGERAAAGLGPWGALQVPMRAWPLGGVGLCLAGKQGPSHWALGQGACSRVGQEGHGSPSSTPEQELRACICPSGSIWIEEGREEGLS